jgi:hypothetical protein
MGQYEKHLKYRLTCVRGNMFSYERVRREIRQDYSPAVPFANNNNNNNNNAHSGILRHLQSRDVEVLVPSTNRQDARNLCVLPQHARYRAVKKWLSAHVPP